MNKENKEMKKVEIASKLEVNSISRLEKQVELFGTDLDKLIEKHAIETYEDGRTAYQDNEGNMWTIENNELVAQKRSWEGVKRF